VCKKSKSLTPEPFLVSKFTHMLLQPGLFSRPSIGGASSTPRPCGSIWEEGKIGKRRGRKREGKEAKEEGKGGQEGNGKESEGKGW